MGAVKVVTGYVPIQGHPRAAAEYGTLGEGIFKPLTEAGVIVHPFYETLEECWMTQLIRANQQKWAITHSTADNPKKNTLAYHIVQHQKFAWLLKSALADPSFDTFVWIDYGIGHVPGVTAAVILEFLDQVQDDDLAIPGCWARENMMLNPAFPCWRFCGGLMVVPRTRVHRLFKAVKSEVRNTIHRTQNITWEVNTLAQLEKARSDVGIRWYEADHNQTMFTNYAKDLDHE